jgi:hypothetical protein
MKRLKRRSKLDIEDLELQYQRLQDDLDVPEEELYHLENNVNNDKKTFFIQPGNLLVEYDDNLLDTTMRPGIPGYWQASERWIYK